MRGDRSLRLTGLYIWAGQFISFFLVFLFGVPNKAFWPLHISLFCLGLVLLLVFNLKYWLKKDLPLWETNFLKWVKTCTLKEMADYLEAINVSNQVLQKLTITVAQHENTFVVKSQIRCFVWYGFGFYDHHRLHKGDIILNNHIEGYNSPVKFEIIDIMYCKDRKDMFYAYVVIKEFGEIIIKNLNE